jgi:hypothetical protein
MKTSFNFRTIKLEEYSLPDEKFKNILTKEQAKRYCTIPVEVREDGTVIIAVPKEATTGTIDAIHAIFSCEYSWMIDFVYAEKDSISNRISIFYDEINIMPSRLLLFYSCDVTDSENRTFEDILKFNDEELEKCHNYIQWIFPTDEPSQHNKTAPIIESLELHEFIHSEKIQNNFFKALKIILKFYGFDAEFNGNKLSKIEKSIDFEEKINKWFRYRNHNLLRISRILLSMNLFGHKDLAAFIFGYILGSLSQERIEKVGIDVVEIWMTRAGIK